MNIWKEKIELLLNFDIFLYKKKLKSKTLSKYNTSET